MKTRTIQGNAGTDAMILLDCRQGVCLSVRNGASISTAAFTPVASKQLRKALKRAERELGGA